MDHKSPISHGCGSALLNVTTLTFLAQGAGLNLLQNNMPGMVVYLRNFSTQAVKARESQVHRFTGSKRSLTYKSHQKQAKSTNTMTKLGGICNTS